MKEYDFIIVGAGLFGSTFAWFAKKAGKRCLLIEKRSHIGGNLYCDIIEDIPIHKYGAHIFHTSNKSVWKFVNSFVPFNGYINSPIAIYQGQAYNLPFNMNTFNKLWGTITPGEANKVLNIQREEALNKLKNASVSEPRNLEEQALLLVGKDIYEKLIKGYTEKQWGRKCTDLPSFIIKRLPIRMVYDNNYFNDPYQGIPTSKDGYNTLIRELIGDSEIVCNKTFSFEDINYWKERSEHIIYTGPIDALFDYKFGKLEYRTVRFENKILNTPNFQGNAVVNYTEAEIPYTRIIEHKHFCMFGEDIYKIPQTVISKEFPVEWVSGMEPYYPINNDTNAELYKKYQQEVSKLDFISVGGRLGLYKYIDMDKTIEEAMSLAKNLLST